MILETTRTYEILLNLEANKKRTIYFNSFHKKVLQTQERSIKYPKESKLNFPLNQVISYKITGMMNSIILH